MRFSTTFIALGCSVSALAMPAAALAQTAPADPAAAEAAAESTSGLDDIVVTAQKGARGESVQRVPIAVTAVSGAMIANMHAVTLQDVAQVAPNVNFTGAATLPGFANFFIRGIGISGSTSSIDPAVNVVVDGMVYNFQGGTILDAFDVDSIEILRGPQGILFGRNTTGGAVSLRTRRPTNYFNAEAEVTVGNYNRRDVSAMVRGPIIKDSLLGKITVLYRSRDGYVKDNNGGTFAPAPLNPTGVQPASPKGTVGDVDMFAIRPSLTWLPASNVEVSLLGEYVHMNGGGAYPRIRPGFDTLLRTRFGYTPPPGAFKANLNVIGFTRIRAPRIVGEVNWDVGVGKVTSVTGYRDVDYQFSFDDATPFVIIEFPRGNKITSKQFSEELRFASTFSDVFDFVVGGFYDHHKLGVVERRNQANLVANPNAPTYVVTPLQAIFTQKAEAAAAFANVNVHPIPDLTLTAGGRYSWERKEIVSTPLSGCAGPGFTNCSTTIIRSGRSFRNFSPKLGAQYNFNKDVLLYGSWTKGFRSGNYNNRGTSLLQLGPVNPEKASSFEIGLKSTFLDRRVRVNLTGYHTKYDDLQLTILQGALQVLQNAGAATFKGVEFETTVRPIDPLELTGSFGYTDAQYDRLNGPLPGKATVADSLKLELLKVPKYTAYGSAAYTIELPDMDTDIVARVAYAWKSHFYADVLNNPFARQDAYGTLDASITATHGNWRVSLFGRNLTNVSYFESESITFVPVIYGGEPRTYGLSLSYKI